MTSGSLVEVSTVDVDGGVVTVVRMTAGENLINPAFVDGLATALDRAADPGGPLVLTGTGKFFCNGLDLAWLGSASPDELGATFRAFYRVLARLLRFPGATVAAVN
ncbi:MAG: enoyl-CoA hydratase/isomerase family protein, partial [Frankia sp.]|nr:enoyl-CoA hydratase/isomerase family protein [Frankia sp.]